MIIVAAAIAGWAAGAAATVATGFTLAAFSWSAFATSLVLSGVSQALAPNQSTNTGSGAVGSQGRLVTVRQPISYHQVIVGRARVGGAITYMELVGSDLHMIITWAGHVCQSIDEIWFGDELQTIDGSGNTTTGAYAETPVSEYLSVTGTTATLSYTPVGAVVVTGMSNTVDMGGTFLTYTDVSPAAPTVFSEYSLSGKTLTFGAAPPEPHVTASYSASTADVPPAGGTTSYAKIQNSLGDEAGQPFPDLVAASNGKWTDAHRQTGCAKSYIRLTANPDKFPNGVPNITAVIKGAKIYDPRTPATAWSANAALWISHYLSDAADYGVGADYATEIDATDLTAAANVCDEQVALAGSPTTYENRYEVNGAFKTSEQPKDVITRLLSAMAGRAVAAGEKWHIHAGAYETPTVTISDGDLAGPVVLQSLISRRESCNGVKGLFTDPNSSWQPTDFPPYPAPGSAYDTWIALDNNERIWRDVDYSPFVISGTQAQRLAKIELLRTRYAMAETAPCKLTAYKAMTGRTVGRTDTQMGWTDEPFDVVGSRFAITSKGELGVELSLQRTASAVYDWSIAEEQAVTVAGSATLPTAYPTSSSGASGAAQQVAISDTSVTVTSTVVSDQNVGGNQTVAGQVFATNVNSLRNYAAVHG